MNGLTRDDSSVIGFVAASFFENAIDTAELRQWAEHVVASYSDYPDYIIDFLEFDEPRFHLYRVVGFTSDRELSETESLALSGIAYARGREVYDGPQRQEALDALRACRHVQAEFESTFPFLGPIQVAEAE